MKKTNIFIISILILLSFATVSFAFTDTNEHWANDTIEKLSQKNIVNGYDDGTFKPNKEMTRAEFITVINRILGLKEESTKYIPDVSRQDWFYSEVRKAVEAGLIEGDESGYIMPNSPITREEAVLILDRAFHIGVSDTLLVQYKDAEDISNWAQKEFYKFANNEYLKGYDDNTIKPKGAISRAETLTIIERIIPNILSSNVYTGLINGNTLLFENNTVLNNLTIDGDLIIPDFVLTTLKVDSVTLKGNLIVSNKENNILSKIKVMGNIYEITSRYIGDGISYENNDYGIRFSVPKSTEIKVLSGNKKINFKEKDLIVVDFKKDDAYYLKNIKTIAREESNRYDNLFGLVESGDIDGLSYMLYDDNESTQMVVIKRDNIVYTILFINIVSENLVENVLSTAEFFETENIIDSKNIVYKNSKLSLKFNYNDTYVAVDDSYNTNVVNEEERLFKLFIQVNTITDIQDYNVDELADLLSILAKSDGDILNTEKFKVVNNDAIKYRIKSEDKLINSLYVIVGNNLYNFIFVGEEYGMQEVGESMFEIIIETLEV